MGLDVYAVDYFLEILAKWDLGEEKIPTKILSSKEHN